MDQERRDRPRAASNLEHREHGERARAHERRDPARSTIRGIPGSRSVRSGGSPGALAGCRRTSGSRRVVADARLRHRQSHSDAATATPRSTWPRASRIFAASRRTRADLSRARSRRNRHARVPAAVGTVARSWNNRAADYATMLAELRERVRLLDSACPSWEASLTSPASRSAPPKLGEQAARPDSGTTEARAGGDPRELARHRDDRGLEESAQGRRRGARCSSSSPRKGDAEALAELKAKVEGVTTPSTSWSSAAPRRRARCRQRDRRDPSGRSGLEAQDWAEMLLRMYLRWASARLQDGAARESPGEGAGIKSARSRSKGRTPYGYARAESGVAPARPHLALRPRTRAGRPRSRRCSSSPTSRTRSRSTSATTDLRIRHRNRSSGAGGQHVNKTDSAVRLTTCRRTSSSACQTSARSTRNKAMAMKILKARLFELRAAQAAGEDGPDRRHEEGHRLGHRSRSYVLHPTAW